MTTATVVDLKQEYESSGVREVLDELDRELDKAYKLGQTTLDEQVRAQGDVQWRELRAARRATRRRH